MKELYQKEPNKNSLEEIIKRSIETLNSNTEKSKLEKVIRDGYCDTFISIDWSKVRLNRTAFINKALMKLNIKGAHYLEIGVFDNINFSSVASKNKISVDPDKNTKPTFLGTSDDFFAQNDKLFDVIFIDGLHTFDQCRKDAINALKFVKKNGFIFFHDFVPINWIEEHVPQLRKILWTGDVWKVSIELTKTSGIDFKVILADHGIGVVKKKEEVVSYCNEEYDKLKKLKFRDFLKLNELVPYVDAWEAFKSLD